MSKINDILELAIKANIFSADNTDLGDSVLNELSNKINELTKTQSQNYTQSCSQTGSIGFYGGYTLPSLISDPQGVIEVGYEPPFNKQTGTCCLWTVPSGVSIAQFQIWGAGGNGSGCSGSVCCAYYPNGSSGEYTFVTMGVTPGQTYTLCAGGGDAVTNNNCHTTCTCNGCTSFVCGSNDTCILSCGGLAGYGMFGTSGTTIFPNAGSNYAFHQGNFYVQTSSFNCQSFFSYPLYRCGGSGTGVVRTKNTVLSQTKIPSLMAGTQQCGSSVCYMRIINYAVKRDHSVCFICTPWNGYDYSGCCVPINLPEVRALPGVGGFGAIHACIIGPSWGSCSNSGAIVVSYK